MPFLLWLIVGTIVLVVVIKVASVIVRRQRIYAKHGRTEVAKRIIQKIIWIGETAEDLRDRLGLPVDIDDKVFKSKRRDTWNTLKGEGIALASE